MIDAPWHGSLYGCIGCKCCRVNSVFLNWRGWGFVLDYNWRLYRQSELWINTNLNLFNVHPPFSTLWKYPTQSLHHLFFRYRKCRLLGSQYLWRATARGRKILVRLVALPRSYFWIEEVEVSYWIIIRFLETTAKKQAALTKTLESKVNPAEPTSPEYGLPPPSKPTKKTHW